MARSPKSLAKHAPVIGRILREKHQLELKVVDQQKQLKELTRRNKKLREELLRRKTAKKSVLGPRLKAEILKAEKQRPVTAANLPKVKPPFKINWVIPPVIGSSGGQSDIFRAIKFLRGQGHDCRLYIFDPSNESSLAKQKTLIEAAFPGLSQQLAYNSPKMVDCDVIFATHWLTAYPVYNFRGCGRKYYFAQGYEPHTQPAGYLSQLAEATYGFGFRGLVLGEWLAEKLSRDYKMDCQYFDFGYDPTEYYRTNSSTRQDVLYYAQPQKAHRGFELGIMALEIFHRQHPKSKIHLFGEDLSNYDIPFPYEGHGIMTPHQLNELYNHCAAGLALSFTNISLIPIEMIAAGCQPVVNDAYQNHKIRYAKWVDYAPPEPAAMTGVLVQAVKANRRGLKHKIPQAYSWDHSNRQIEDILIKDLSR